ncbi:BQ5605_C012g06948 [Microbotryum silenes-dioicae]|uniref:BQ5605_C012g06948 protein n=1 Tax=Microbotryum silenes-dioicae TaxID=796604 RepID=A0A2X0LSS9_9BASI|nr:BQ5605_C012g06948 [Microbotryum silenes-dioicae]
MPSAPIGIALVGGIPTKSQDLPSSIIFAIAFAFLAPLAIYRFLQPSSRTTTLIRPAIFIVARIATYCIRAVIADGDYAIGLFTAELASPSLAINSELERYPLAPVESGMLEAHVTRHREPSIYNKDLMDRAVRLLKLALLIALILGIVAGSSVSGVEEGTGSLSSYKAERNANVIICLAVVVLTIAVSLIAQAQQSLPMTATLHLIVCAALLVSFCVVPCSLCLLATRNSITQITLYLSLQALNAIFKLYTYLNPGDPLSASTKVLFYVLLSTPEWIVTLLYLVFNIQELYQLQYHSKKVKEEKRLKKAAKNGGGAYDLEQGKSSLSR